CCQQLVASALEHRVVIWRHAVDPKHRMAVDEQASHQMEADESGAAGNQKAHEIPHLAAAGCAWSDRRPRRRPHRIVIPGLSKFQGSRTASQVDEPTNLMPVTATRAFQPTSSNMHRKILIMGLPGAGKTTLSKVLAPRLNGVHFNADEVRANINKDLGFSEDDRIEHARRMGWLCDQVVHVGGYAIADVICPTPQAREAFSAGGEPFVIWIDRIKQRPFRATNRMFG